MQFIKSFVLLVVLSSITATVKFEYNDHTMYEVIPETTAHIKSLKDIRDSKAQHWIFWNTIGEPGSGIYIILNNHMKLDFLEVMTKTGIQKIKELYEVEIILKPKENVDTCKKPSTGSSYGLRSPVADPEIVNPALTKNTRCERAARNIGDKTFSFTDKSSNDYLSKAMGSIFDTMHVPSDSKLSQLALNLLDLSHLPEMVKDPEARSALEDLAFAQMFPGDRDFILDRMKAFGPSCHPSEPNPLNHHINVVEELVRTQYPMKNFTVHGRLKSSYSTWQKLQRKLYIYEEICDQISIMIFVNSIDECSEVQRTLQRSYKMVPGTFKDLIQGTQKDSLKNFHSLKSCFQGPYGKNIEIQIRTVAMNEAAEANHWVYKHRIRILGEV